MILFTAEVYIANKLDYNAIMRKNRESNLFQSTQMSDELLALKTIGRTHPLNKQYSSFHLR